MIASLGLDEASPNCGFLLLAGAIASIWRAPPFDEDVNPPLAIPDLVGIKFEVRE